MVEMYDALHAETARRSGGAVEGLLVRPAGRPPAGSRCRRCGSREHFAHYDEKAVLPTVADMSAGQPCAAPQQNIEEFEVRGLVLEGGKVVV